MAVEAVPQADPTVDFSNYDNDGDNYVDFTGIIHSGADMAVTGDPCNTWSHALPISTLVDVVGSLAGLPGLVRGGLPTLDGVLVDRLFTMPEFDEPGGQLNIGVATHEMGHALGEIDYYNIPGTSEGTGEWDIMAASGYLGRPIQTNPTHVQPVDPGVPGLGHADDRPRRRARRGPAPAQRHAARRATTYGTPNPNLLLVPTKWIKVGQTDELGHVWTADDVYGLVKDGDRGYVIEGYYLEYVSRTARSAPRSTRAMKRSPYFDRAALGVGLLTWHFDYYRGQHLLRRQQRPGRRQPPTRWTSRSGTSTTTPRSCSSASTAASRVTWRATRRRASRPAPTRQPELPADSWYAAGRHRVLRRRCSLARLTRSSSRSRTTPPTSGCSSRPGSSGDCTLTAYKKGKPPPD